MIQSYTQEVVKKGAKHLHDDMIAITLMQEFHWSWEDYQNTPERIIRLIIAKNNIDAKISK